MSWLAVLFNAVFLIVAGEDSVDSVHQNTTAIQPLLFTFTKQWKETYKYRIKSKKKLPGVFQAVLYVHVVDLWPSYAVYNQTEHLVVQCTIGIVNLLPPKYNMAFAL